MSCFVMRNDITFFSEITRDFLAGPAITRSVASSISRISILFLPSRAINEASLSKFSKSAPENLAFFVKWLLSLLFHQVVYF